MLNFRRVSIGKNTEGIVAVLFFWPQINYYIAAILSSYEIPTISIYVYFCLGLLGIYAYLVALLRNVTFTVLGTIAVSITLILSIIANPNVWTYMSGDSILSAPIVQLITIYYPIFLLLCTRLDLKKLFRILLKYSKITILVSLAAFLNYVVFQNRQMPDYMTFAYMSLSAIFICAAAGVSGRSKAELFLSVVGSILILWGGCRGALATLLVFWGLVLCYFFSTKGSIRKTILKILILSLLLVIVLNMEALFVAIEIVLSKYGYNSRTISALTNSIYAGQTISFYDIGGRSDIWASSIDKIQLWGYGVFGDRTIIVNEIGQATYTHNWILEMLISFGWIFGFLLIGVILYFLFKNLMLAVKAKDSIQISLAFAAISILMVKHMVSASFMTSIDFWFYWGISVNGVLKRKAELR